MSIRNKSQKRAGIIKLLLIPVAIIVIGVAGTELNKAYWDHKVDQLCAKDGGVTIYETVVISKKDYPDMRFISTGEPILPIENKANLEDPFFIRHKSEYLHKGFASLRRGETSYVRNSDKKVLSKKILYTRGGGDFPTGFESSHYSCKDWKEYHSKFSSTIKGE